MRSSPRNWTLPSKQCKRSWRSLVAERWGISYKCPVDLFQLRRRIHVKDVLCSCFEAFQMTFVWKRAAAFIGSCLLLKVRQGTAPAGLSPEGGDGRSSVSSFNKDGFSAHSFTIVPPQTTPDTCSSLRHWPWLSQRSLYLLTTMLILLKAVGDIKITLRPLPQTSAGADSIYGAPDLSCIIPSVRSHLLLSVPCSRHSIIQLWQYSSACPVHVSKDVGASFFEPSSIFEGHMPASELVEC